MTLSIAGSPRYRTGSSRLVGVTIGSPSGVRRQRVRYGWKVKAVASLLRWVCEASQRARISGWRDT